MRRRVTKIGVIGIEPSAATSTRVAAIAGGSAAITSSPCFSNVGDRRVLLAQGFGDPTIAVSKRRAEFADCLLIVLLDIF
ncbi:hypothetical protein [Bradyrhizobium manausense]|uniref:hypothetical protein n=1 Tax=Bradyrhizobium manausense TaxID=989370 RepID=UPI0012ED3491|nr:hypothetical protein [Bradyrhizobium manausense]